MSKVDNNRYINTVEYLVTKSFKLGRFLLELERNSAGTNLQFGYRTMYLNLVKFQEELVDMRGLKYEISMESAFKTLQARALYGLSAVHDGLMLIDDDGPGALKNYKRLTRYIETLYDDTANISELGKRTIVYEYGEEVSAFRDKIKAERYFYLFNSGNSACDIRVFAEE